MWYDLCLDDGVIVVVDGGCVKSYVRRLWYDVVAQMSMMSLGFRQISEVNSFHFQSG